MVAAANSGQGPAVSRQTNSVHGANSGGAKQAGGAKKSALGVFAKLLAGLKRTAGTGGEDAGEGGAEGLGGTEKTVRGPKNGSGKKAESPGGEVSLPGKEKTHSRDRRFLAALREEGEGPAPEAASRNGSAKKSKQGQKNPAGEDAVPVAAAEAAPGALLGAKPVSEDPQHEVLSGIPEQEGLGGPAGAETQAPDAAADPRTFQGKRGEGATSALAGAEAGLEASAGAGVEAELSAEAAAALRRARGTEREEPGLAKKERVSPAETRNSRKNRERIALEVRDMRTENNAPGAVQETMPGVEAGAERVADLAVELKSDGRNQEPGQAGQTKTAGQAFEDILARELHQNLNGDIVRQASILVKDGGEGTIRLSLKPESLGMVKVRLEMAENKITGRIIVESNEALRAFEKEIPSLEQAFRDSGFAGASLEMALAGGGGQGSRGQRDEAGALFSSRIVSSNYDAAAETMDVLAIEAGLNGLAGPGVSRVNVLV